MRGVEVDGPLFEGADASNFLKAKGGSAMSKMVELYMARPKRTPTRKNCSDDSKQ